MSVLSLNSPSPVSKLFNSNQTRTETVLFVFIKIKYSTCSRDGSKLQIFHPVVASPCRGMGPPSQLNKITLTWSITFYLPLTDVHLCDLNTAPVKCICFRQEFDQGRKIDATQRKMPHSQLTKTKQNSETVKKKKCFHPKTCERS